MSWQKKKKFEKSKFIQWASSWVGVGKGAKREAGPVMFNFYSFFVHNNTAFYYLEYFEFLI